MAPWTVVGIAALALWSTLTFAQDGGNTGPTDARKRLIEQKLRLVESLVNAPAARPPAEGHEAETSALLQSGRELLDRARQALAVERFDEASAALDEALRNATKASRRVSSRPDVLSTSAQQKDYRDLTDQIATYRGGLAELAKGGNSEARTTLARVDALQAEAGSFAAAERLGEANRKLAEAYRLEVEALSRLRAGQTVMMRLDFRSPADEYTYELRRYQGNEILVDIMLGEGRADGDRRNAVDGLIREGRLLRDQATGRARDGDYRAAVTWMEKATAHLNRALQTMGAPVF